jgi:hypothetical protein
MSYQSEKKYLKKFQLHSKYLFLLGNDSYFEVLGKKYRSFGSFLLNVRKCTEKIINETGPFWGNCPHHT